MDAILESPIDQLEKHLTEAHLLNPEKLATINELAYFYAVIKPNRTRAECFERLFKEIVDSYIPDVLNWGNRSGSVLRSRMPIVKVL